MTDEEYVITLKNCVSMLADGIKYMKEEHQKQFKEAYEKAIKALSEPTIPLSVIEKITTEIEERATYEGIYLDRADVLDIIDKAVKEIEK